MLFMAKLFVKRKDVNKILGEYIELKSDFEYVQVKSPEFEFKTPDEVLAVLRFLRKLCRVKEVYTVDHPLGRGTIVFECPEVRVRVHGDWYAEGNYIEIY